MSVVREMLERTARMELKLHKVEARQRVEIMQLQAVVKALMAERDQLRATVLELQGGVRGSQLRADDAKEARP